MGRTKSKWKKKKEIKSFIEKAHTISGTRRIVGKWEGQKVNGKKKKEIKSFIEKAHTISGTRRIVDVST